MKKILFTFILFVLIISGIHSVYAISYEDAILISCYEETEPYSIDVGENWFELYLDRQSDVYLRIDLRDADESIYVELYTDTGELIDYDYTKYVDAYFLEMQNRPWGYYYIKIYNGYDEYNTAKITSNAFCVDNGLYEMNNWHEYATQIGVDHSIILSDNLTYDDNHRCMDIDVFRYTASKPCMLTVELMEYDYLDLDIYIGDLIIASTDPWVNPIKVIDKEIPYSFNITHGNCYFKLRDGEGNYKLKIQKRDYQSEPIFYHINPIENMLISEFDILTPKIGIIGSNGEVIASYFYVRNGNTLHSDDNLRVSINNRQFTEYAFESIYPNQISDELTEDQNTIEINVKNTTGTESNFETTLPLNYDNTGPTCEDIVVEQYEDSICVNIPEAHDYKGFAIRPYRYRIYKEGQDVPNYSIWSEAKNFSYGIEEKVVFETGTNYIVDVQIRDKIAEKYQYTDNDISKHILTISRIITIE